MKTYWVAHARGPDFEQLKKAGFRTFYPDLDDYVFLEACPENRKKRREQSRYRVAFLKQDGKFVEVTEQEVNRMGRSSRPAFCTGQTVLGVSGIAAHLEGKITEMDGDRLRLELKGWKRTFDVWVDEQEVVSHNP